MKNFFEKTFEKTQNFKVDLITFFTKNEKKKIFVFTSQERKTNVLNFKPFFDFQDSKIESFSSQKSFSTNFFENEKNFEVDPKIFFDFSFFDDTDASLDHLDFGDEIDVVIDDFAVTLSGDNCPSCEKGILAEKRGIEVGQVFYLVIFILFFYFYFYFYIFIFIIF